MPKKTRTMESSARGSARWSARSQRLASSEVAEPSTALGPVSRREATGCARVLRKGRGASEGGG